MIEVAGYAPTIYIASTGCRENQEIWNLSRVLDQRLGSEWVLKDKKILSFHDLRDYPWDRICDKGSVEDFDTDEWAHSEDADMRRDFVRLLNSSLKELTYSRGLRRIRRGKHEVFYFRATKNLQPQKVHYQSLANKVPREVFGSRGSKTTAGKISYYRHSAFHSQFQRYEDHWFLEITPTYHFTRNGYEPLSDEYYSERLKGIKKLEKNPALLGQLLMWASYLHKHDTGLFPADDYQFLKLGDLQTFPVDLGINEAEWLKREEDKSLEESVSELGLFKHEN